MKRCKQTTDEEKTKKRRKSQWDVKPFPPNNLDDLIEIGWRMRGSNPIYRNLWKLISPLTELQKMVGLTNLKKDIVYMVVHYIQSHHLQTGKTQAIDSDTLHTVLYGGPGVGKTRVSHILAKIYSRLGFLKTDKVTIAKRTDFVGKFVGHSEHKTEELLEKACGGVLLIDEAYSLGCGDKTDSFSKAAVDVLNQYLTEHKHDMVCIVAGYKKELHDCFFSLNRGLDRRFTWKFSIGNYTSEDMGKIFQNLVKKLGWVLCNKVNSAKFFSTHMDDFPFFGGDIDTFLRKCMYAHSRRVLFLSQKCKKILIQADMDEGYKLYISHKNNSSRLSRDKQLSMYL